MKRTVSVTVLVLGIACAGGVPVGATARPQAGVVHYNYNMCGSDWTTVRTPYTYVRVLNDDFGSNTCLAVFQHSVDFRVSYVDNVRGFYSYPNISAGWEGGRDSCQGHTGACYAFPVPVTRDGSPKITMSAWLASGSYDYNNDIWFASTCATPVPTQTSSHRTVSEVMVWWAYPGMSIAWGRMIRYVHIDGMEFAVNSWRTNRPGGVHWQLTIYTAVHPAAKVAGKWLNPFFRDAEANGELPKSACLTSIDSGFERVGSGLEANIHFWELSGLPEAAADSRG